MGVEPAKGSWGTSLEALQVPLMACVLTVTLNPMDMGPLNTVRSQIPGGPEKHLLRPITVNGDFL